MKWLSISPFCASRNSAKTAVCMAAAFGWIWRAVTLIEEEVPAVRTGEKANLSNRREGKAPTELQGAKTPRGAVLRLQQTVMVQWSSMDVRVFAGILAPSVTVIDFRH